MLVGTLTQFLLSLSAPLEASGASRKLLDDLEKTVKALDHFHDRQVEDLADFLVRAEAYERDGQWTKTGKAPAKPRAPRSPAKMTIDDAHDHAVKLYDRADAEDMTHDLIAAEVRKLESLTRKDLHAVSQRLGLAASTKMKKADILALIQDKVATRRSTFLRTQF